MTDTATLALYERARHEPALARSLIAIADAYDLGRRDDLEDIAANAIAVITELAPALGRVIQAAIYTEGLRPSPGASIADPERAAELHRIAARLFDVTSPLCGDSRFSARCREDHLAMSRGSLPIIAVAPRRGGKRAAKERAAARRDDGIMDGIHAVTLYVAHYRGALEGVPWLDMHERLFPGLHGRDHRVKFLKVGIGVGDRCLEATTAGKAVAQGSPVPPTSASVMLEISRWLEPDGITALQHVRIHAASGDLFRETPT